MAQNKKRRGLSYYFRIEFETLQGKITSGFCFLGVFAVALMYAAISIIKPGLEKSQYITNVLNASTHQLLLLSATSEKIVMFAENKILKAEDFSKEDYITLSQQLQQPLDSLKELSAHWKSSEAVLNLKLAQLKGESLQKLLKTLSRGQTAENGIPEMLELQKVIATQAAKVHGQLTAEIKEGQAYINYRSDNLFLSLAAASTFALLIGAVLGSYIVMQVLREIRMLKGKIIEISSGKLIAAIPNSRNELNSIIKALNSLTENLRSIQQFAREVGNGNFDTHVSVFNGENDLGESLASMRDSLKRVAQEEERRKWVTAGFAQFSELLRNPTTDMSAYYQTIISELVRYLKVNQAAIYVYSGTQGSKGVLELKASYAYGRLKYNSKILEPGQGLAGQVFLEKEAVFLKNIPKNFMQISSGLGEATAGHLVVVPLKVNQEVNGVLELASFQALEPHEVEFLMKIAESISSAIQNVTNIHTTAQLLEEAQAMTQAMRSQEEMLRQNSEELIATQEQLNRDLHETSQQLQLLEHALQNSALPQLVLTESGTIRLANKQAVTLIGKQAEGMHVSAIFELAALTSAVQRLKADETSSLSFTHPQKGALLFHLQGFSVEQEVFISLQIATQASVILA